MTKEELEAENAELKAKLEAAQKAKKADPVEVLDAFDAKWKPLILQKMKAGLNREQAVTAIRNQLAEDKKRKSDIAEKQLAAITKK